MAFGIGKAIKKGWKKAFGWADDDWAKPVIAAVGGGVVGLGAYTMIQGMRDAKEAQKEQIAAMRDIANQQAAAAAVPVATSVAEQKTVTDDTADINAATERRRAYSVADTTTSSRLQRWASSGKRKTLG